MDEPTEGLAPVIVDQIVALLAALADDGSIDTLLVEQNLKAALAVAPRIAVMVNGRIAVETDSATLAADRDMQRRMLGVAGEATDTPQNAPAEGEADPDHARGESTGAAACARDGVRHDDPLGARHARGAAACADIASPPGSAPAWDMARPRSDAGAASTAQTGGAGGVR